MLRTVAVVFCAAAPYCTTSLAQQFPAPVALPRRANIFSAAQESELGDIIAEQAEREFRVLPDAPVTAHLQQIAVRLARQVPGDVYLRVRIVDLAVTNAFTMPGGRIYVTRKLIAFTRSDAELAAVLGHELGHAVAHDPAAEMSQLFQKLLGVNQVRDRRDIYDKYNLLLDTWRRKRFSIAEDRDREQLQADQIAIYALARAGYDVSAFARFWDRFAETHGKTGSWLSDLFGATGSDSRRLREATKAVGNLPPACIEKAPVTSADEFNRWREQVIEFSGRIEHEAVLPGLISKTHLEPPLRTDLTLVRFSPDGKLILAQDESGIYVLTRDPLALPFRIDADDAYAAQFTPDSGEIVFYDETLRVQRWDVAQRKSVAISEVSIRGGCMQHALSPDGKVLACVVVGSRMPLSLSLKLVDVGSNNVLYEKKDVYPPVFADVPGLLAIAAGIQLLHMRFSPDAKYLLVARGTSAVAVDVPGHHTISLPNDLQDALGEGFTFLGPDRIACTKGLNGENSAVMEFPSEKVLERLKLGRSGLFPVTRGHYVLLEPVKDYPVGVYDLEQKKLIMANKTPAIDMYGDYFLGERRSGELGLYKVGQQGSVALLTLPEAPLGRLTAAAVSPDLSTLALSRRTRGGVFNPRTGERMMYPRGFRTIWIDGNNDAYAEFLKADSFEHTIG